MAKYVAMLRLGEIDKVRGIVDSLEGIYPDSPDVLFLKASVIEDADEALEIYYQIFLNHPDSRWADDAIYRVFQYFYARGDYKSASRELRRLKRMYPGSPYAKVEVDSGFSDKIPGSLGRWGISNRCMFSLQVGAFLDIDNAEKERKYFERLGFNVELHTRYKDGKLFYLVWIGCYETRDKARSGQRDLRVKYGRDSFIISRQKK
jgi:tetratricopeptide (TPR) repeat protein